MIRRPPKKPAPIPIHSRLEPGDHERLTALADQQNSSVARIVKLAVIDFLAHSRESELVETPPHRAEIWFSSVPCGPLPASGARKAAPLRNRSKGEGSRAAQQA
jgi:hypothetical protein